MSTALNARSRPPLLRGPLRPAVPLRAGVRLDAAAARRRRPGGARSSSRTTRPRAAAGSAAAGRTCPAASLLFSLLLRPPVPMPLPELSLVAGERRRGRDRARAPTVAAAERRLPRTARRWRGSCRRRREGRVVLGIGDQRQPHRRRAAGRHVKPATSLLVELGRETDRGDLLADDPRPSSSGPTTRGLSPPPLVRCKRARVHRRRATRPDAGRCTAAAGDSRSRACSRSASGPTSRSTRSRRTT